MFNQILSFRAHLSLAAPNLRFDFVDPSDSERTVIQSDSEES